MSDPWEAWGELAGEAWQHTLEVANATLLDTCNFLDEEAAGSYVWLEESLYKTETGVYLFARRERRAGQPDTLRTLVGATADELVKAIREQLGMTPGRVEVLGRGGIEIGLEPDNDIEGDELEGPGEFRSFERTS